MSDPANAKETPNMWERYTALERENADLREDNRKLALHTAAQATELADLRANLEAARKDAERKKNAD